MRRLRTIIKRARNPNAVITLQQRSKEHVQGSAHTSKEWSDDDEDSVVLTGVIYSPRQRRVNDEGMYDGGQRKGVFLPEFNIYNMTDFRLKVDYYTESEHENLDKTEFYTITGSNQDLYLRGKQHHIELDLKLSSET